MNDERKKLEKLFAALSFDDIPDHGHRDRLEKELLAAFAAKSRPEKIWRKIMNTPITKTVAAAVVIVVAVTITAVFLSQSATPAYAIEQTIEAFENVRFLHLLTRNESDQIEDERWIEIGDHGRQVKYRQENPPNRLVVEDGRTTAEYHEDSKTVVLYSNRDKQYQWVGNIGVFLENLKQKGKIIGQNLSYNGRPAHKVLWPMMNAECFVDAETKLPVAIGPMELSYEIPPDGTFQITIPHDYTVVDKRPGAAPANEPDWLIEKELADKYFHAARYSMVAGEYENAAQLLEYVTEKQPGRNWAWFWLARTYYELAEFELAVEKYSKVIQIMGDVPYCLYARGLAYAQLSMHAEAQNDFKKPLPSMIRALRDTTAAAMFEYADDPILRDGKSRPAKTQTISRMIDRLRIITGQNFGYDSKAGEQENEKVIRAWEDWFESSQETGL
jgi:hypothetical protein